MTSRSVVTLDIGAAKAACVSARLSESGKFEVLSIVVEPCKGVRKGVISDVDECAKAAQSAFRAARAESEVDCDSIVVALSGACLRASNGHGLKLIYPKGRFITYQDLLEVIRHSRIAVVPNGREQIQAVPRDFKVDAESGVLKPIGMPASRLEVSTLIFSAESSTVQAIEKILGRSSKQIDQLVHAALAAGVGSLTPAEIESGAAVVDIGQDGMSIGVFSSGTIAAAAYLPAGSGYITSDIAKLLKCAQSDAELLKVEHGGAVPELADASESVEVRQIGQPDPRPMKRQVLCEIIQSRVGELAAMACQEIDRLSGSSALSGGIVLTGGGAQLPGIDKVFDSAANSKGVRIGGPTDRAGLVQPSLAVAVGLARYALQCQEELSTVTGSGTWKDRVVRNLFSLIGGK